jgi:hypothetical protein
MRFTLILPPAHAPEERDTSPGDDPLLDDDSPTERFTRDDIPTWVDAE